MEDRVERVCLELGYFPWRCLLCHAVFPSHSRLLLHFSGPLSLHAGQPLRFTEQRNEDNDRLILKMVSDEPPPDPLASEEDVKPFHPMDPDIHERKVDVKMEFRERSRSPIAPSNLSPTSCQAGKDNGATNWETIREPMDPNSAAVPVNVDHGTNSDPSPTADTSSNNPQSSELSADSYQKLRCELCDKAVASGRKNRHIQSVHLKRSYECNFCDSAYSHPRDLRKHAQKTHPKSDDIASTEKKIEEVRSNLNRMTQEMRDQCFPGSNASHVSRSRVSPGQGSEERRFPCRNCDFKFKTSSNLRRHLARVHKVSKEDALAYAQKLRGEGKFGGKPKAKPLSNKVEGEICLDESNEAVDGAESILLSESGSEGETWGQRRDNSLSAEESDGSNFGEEWWR